MAMKESLFLLFLLAHAQHSSGETGSVACSATQSGTGLQEEVASNDDSSLLARQTTSMHAKDHAVGSRPGEVMPSLPSVLLQTGDEVSSDRDTHMALFQNFVETEVQKSIKDGNYTIPGDASQAFDQIREHMKTFSEATAVQHASDQDELDTSAALVQKCVDTAEEELRKPSRGVDALKASTDTKRTEHQDCRSTEQKQQAAQTTACTAYDAARSGRLKEAPSCMMTALSPEKIVSSSETTLAEMEICLAEVAAWSGELSDFKTACRSAQTTFAKTHADCEAKQTVFEGKFCLYSEKLTDVCSTQRTCHESTANFFDNLVDKVRVKESARQRDHSSSALMLCLIDVLQARSKDKAGKFDKCKTSSLSTDAAELDIKYPEAATPVQCIEEALEPCGSDWLNNEYEQKAWYAQDRMATCSPCEEPTTTTTTTTAPAGFWKTHPGQGNCDRLCKQHGGICDVEPLYDLDRTSCLKHLKEGMEPGVFEDRTSGMGASHRKILYEDKKAFDGSDSRVTVTSCIDFWFLGNAKRKGKDSGFLRCDGSGSSYARALCYCKTPPITTTTTTTTVASVGFWKTHPGQGNCDRLCKQHGGICDMEPLYDLDRTSCLKHLKEGMEPGVFEDRTSGISASRRKILNEDKKAYDGSDSRVTATSCIDFWFLGNARQKGKDSGFLRCDGSGSSYARALCYCKKE